MAARERGPRRTPALIARLLIPLGLCYFVIIGGTAVGEVNPVIRALNGTVGAAFIALFLIRGPRDADWLDRRALLAVLLLGGAAVLSEFPRQSLDALISAFAMAAGLFVVRGAMADSRARDLAVVALRSLSLGLTVLVTVLWAGSAAAWFSITGEPVAPIGLAFSPGAWGHRYDVALLLILLVPSWFVAPRSRTATLIGTIVGIATGGLAVLSGSRAVWLAALLATVAIGAPYVMNRLRRRRLAGGVAIAGAVVVTVFLLSPLGHPVMDRLFYSSTIGLRAEMWASVTEAWIDRPVAGWGPGSFPWLLQTTDWFASNTAAPIHPDNALVQALGEGGLLGLAAIGVLVSAWPRIWAATATPIKWVTVTFVVACLGTNPAAFPFFVAVIGVWVAIAVPRIRGEGAVIGPRWRSRMAFGLASGAAGVVAIVFASLTAAHVSYAGATSDVAAGRVAAANDALSTAVTLDPGMSLYWRDRAVARWILGQDEAADRDLAIAETLNPWDDLTWRAETVIRLDRGNATEAVTAIRMAAALQRSDVANLLMAAIANATAGRSEDAQVALAEVVQAWPTVTGSQGWAETAGLVGGDPITAARERWDAGSASPEKPGYQASWLQAVTGGPTSFATSLSSGLTAAMTAALRCDPEAGVLLGRLDRSDLIWPEYWETRLRVASNAGTTDEAAMVGFALTSHFAPGELDPDALLNPLNDGMWSGYRRIPTFWPAASPLPSPDAGRLRWGLRPREAIEEAGLQSRLPECQADSREAGDDLDGRIQWRPAAP